MNAREKEKEMNVKEKGLLVEKYEKEIQRMK